MLSAGPEGVVARREDVVGTSGIDATAAWGSSCAPGLHAASMRQRSPRLIATRRDVTEPGRVDMAVRVYHSAVSSRAESVTSSSWGAAGGLGRGWGAERRSTIRTRMCWLRQVACAEPRLGETA